MPAPELLRVIKAPDEIPHLKVIDARMFKRNILYYLFFLQDRMVFVRMGKSSFLIDNRDQIRKGIYGIMIPVFIFGVFIPGAVFYSEYILGIEPNRDEGDIGFFDSLLLLSMPVLGGYVLFVYYVERKLRLARSERQKTFDIISGIIPKKDFNADKLIRLTDKNRDIYYSEVKSVYIDEIDPEDQSYGEENSRGYLMFDLSRNSKNPNFGNKDKNSTLSNEFVVYNISVYQDITKCKEMISRYLDKITKNEKEGVASLGYTVKKQRRLQKILKYLFVIGVIGWVYTARTLHDKILDNELVILTVAGVGLVLLFLYVFRGKHWYKPNYFLYWSENKRRWHEKHPEKLLILFIIAIVISVVTAYLIYVIGPESIFERSQQGPDSINIGNKLFSDGKYQEAIKYYDRALIREPDNVQVINQKGVALTLLGRYQEAISLYDIALEYDPNYENALYNKGNALHWLERYQDAINWYDKSLEINPNDALALFNKGSALFSLEKYQEAINWYDKSLEINPNDAIVLEQKGHALFSLERYQDAINWYDKALAIEPNNDEILSYKNEALNELQKDKIQTLYDLSKQN